MLITIGPYCCCYYLVSVMTPWTGACKAPLPMRFPKTRILEWTVIFFSRNLPHRGIEPESLALAGDFFIAESQGCSGPY